MTKRVKRAVLIFIVVLLFIVLVFGLVILIIDHGRNTFLPGEKFYMLVIHHHYGEHDFAEFTNTESRLTTTASFYRVDFDKETEESIVYEEAIIATDAGEYDRPFVIAKRWGDNAIKITTNEKIYHNQADSAVCDKIPLPEKEGKLVLKEEILDKETETFPYRVYIPITERPSEGEHVHYQKWRCVPGYGWQRME